MLAVPVQLQLLTGPATGPCITNANAETHGRAVQLQPWNRGPTKLIVQHASRRQIDELSAAFCDAPRSHTASQANDPEQPLKVSRERETMERLVPAKDKDIHRYTYGTQEVDAHTKPRGSPCTRELSRSYPAKSITKRRHTRHRGPEERQVFPRSMHTAEYGLDAGSYENLQC